MKIVEIAPQSDFNLFIRTDDGRSGLFDVKPYLRGEAFEPLNERSEFEQIYNGGYFVEWNCGADLSADTILAHLKVGSEQ